MNKPSNDEKIAANTADKPDFHRQLNAMLHENSVRIMLFLGFSAGLPLSLVFGTLSVWLNEAGVSKSTITFFSWAGLGYGFKFAWAPLIDQARLPMLTRRLGKRRAWLFFCQCLLLVILAAMALIDPISTTYSLTVMALLAVALGFTSASQDIVIDAYRIEITPPELLGMSAASYSFGYRIAMIVSGAAALMLSEYFGSSKENYAYDAWQITYLLMALLMFVGITTTLLIREPAQGREPLDSNGSKQLMTLFIVLLVPFIGVQYGWKMLQNLLLDGVDIGTLGYFVLSVLRFTTAAVVCYIVARQLIQKQLVPAHIAADAYWQPVKEFIDRYPLKLVILLLLLIGFYRISDMVLGVIANIFYQDIGFSKTEFSLVSKTFGIAVTIIGTFIGGFLIMRLGVMRMMMLGAILAAATNLLFMIQAAAGDVLWLLFFVIIADNLAGGIASIAFVTFLSRLSNIQFTAMQYAIFTSIMVMLPRVIGGYSGTIVDTGGYSTFFLITTLMGLPVILLVYLVGKRLTFDEDT